MLKNLVFLLTLLVTFGLASLSVNAAGPICSDDHIVQANDWLSKLADQYHGDIFVYPAIVAATNLAAEADSSYAHIDNPDLIEIGQKLCIPETDVAQYIADQIENAMSAAPELVAKDATILGEVDGESLVLRGREAMTGPACPIGSIHQVTIQCALDKSWVAWYEAYLAGTDFQATAPGFSYMLQGGWDPSNTDPYAAPPEADEDWVVSPAHVMIIVPGDLDPAIFSTDPDSGGPYIMWEGTDFEHIMMPVEIDQTAQTVDQVENAMSAAPELVAKDATILGEVDGESLVLREGSNDWTCMPDWVDSPGNDPMCLDKSWVAWYEAYLAGTDFQATAPGFSYMLQGGWDPSNTDPYAAPPEADEDWVVSPAHVMIIVPGDLDPAIFSTDPDSGGPYIMWEGTDFEHIMMPVER